MVFFFSSRRRHTRYWRDWSSDVCSSDLTVELARELTVNVATLDGLAAGDSVEVAIRPENVRLAASAGAGAGARAKIGRASCRERVEVTEVDGTVPKKHGNRRNVALRTKI